MPKKKTKSKNYRSNLEEEVSKIMPNGTYECEKIEYTIPATTHNYTPDFTTGKIRWEVKGRFRDIDEARKYIFIKDSNPDIDLRFIISSEKTMMPKSKKTTMKGWLEKNGFTVYVWPNVPKKCIFAKN